MDKREGIREGIASVVYFKTTGLHPEGTNTTSHFIDEEAIGPLLKYLDSKGVVIKVEDWLPVRSGMTCTIEPLV